MFGSTELLTVVLELIKEVRLLRNEVSRLIKEMEKWKTPII